MSALKDMAAFIFTGDGMMYDPNTRTITTDRLILRPFELSDAIRVSELCNNYNIHKNTLNIPYPYPIESALSWISTHWDNFSNDKSYEFAVTDRLTGELYGAIGLISNDQRHKNGEVGYWLGEGYWGNNYTAEALKAIIRFAFLEKDYHKVYGRHIASNPASGRVMKKAGMVEEGIFREHVVKENKYEDLICYGIIRHCLEPTVSALDLFQITGGD